MKIEEINIQLLPSVSITNRKELPQSWAVYFAISENEILYIGASANVRSRWMQHNKLKELSEFPDVRIAWLEFSNSAEVVEMERRAIKFFEPPLNSDGAYIRPTLSSEKVRLRLNLEDIIKSNNKSIYSVAKETGITYTVIYKLCKKPVCRISFEVLSALCKNLKCTPNDILPIGY